MPEDEELERRLAAMFASARPRGGFEDELWRRIQARRPWPERLLGWFRAPAHLAPALAALVVVAGLGWVVTGFHPSGNAATSSSAGGAPGGGAPLFGILPVPATSGKGAADRSAGPALSVPGVPGSAELAVPTPSGQAPAVPGGMTVYRFDEPSPAAVAAAAAALSERSGLPVQVLPGEAATGRPPSFQVTGLSSPVGPEGEAAAARDLLGAHNLVPRYRFEVLTGTDRVVYERIFVDPAAGAVPVVGADGSPAGLEVDFSGGLLVSVRGPLELALASAPYPTRGPLAGSPGGRLVYVLVLAGGHGYYEPELLTGDGLRPVIAPHWLAG